MRRIKTYGYDSYRGKTKLQSFLTFLAVVLLIVLVLAVAFFLLAQRYIVYTDDGQAHLELPFFQKASPAPSAGPGKTDEIVIVTPEPTPEPTPTPDPAVKAVWLLRGGLTDGTAEKQVKAAGGSAAVFNMKADDGTLGYVSDLPQAITFKSSDAKPGLNDSIKALTGGELYTIARVSCFKDNKAPRSDNSLAIKTNSGYNWQDPEGVRWMNVTVPAAREYVIGVCRELAALGFDELLLENSGYPTEGNLHYIKKGEAYDPEKLSEPVESFYAELAEAMADYPHVKLTFSVGGKLLTEEGDCSGQTAELLGKYAQGIYAPRPEEGTDYAKGIAALKEAGHRKELVYILPAGEKKVGEGSTLVKPWQTPAPSMEPAKATPIPTQAPTPKPAQAPESTPEAG